MVSRPGEGNPDNRLRSAESRLHGHRHGIKMGGTGNLDLGDRERTVSGYGHDRSAVGFAVCVIFAVTDDPVAVCRVDDMHLGG